MTAWCDAALGLMVSVAPGAPQDAATLTYTLDGSKPQPDSPAPSLDDLITRLQQATLPVVEGIPCRMAGAIFQGSTALAILEVGTPPDSDVQIVAEGRQVEVQGTTYQVRKITPTELTLLGEKKTLRVPLAPLLMPKR